MCYQVCVCIQGNGKPAQQEATKTRNSSRQGKGRQGREKEWKVKKK